MLVGLGERSTAAADLPTCWHPAGQTLSLSVLISILPLSSPSSPCGRDSIMKEFPRRFLSLRDKNGSHRRSKSGPPHGNKVRHHGPSRAFLLGVQTRLMCL